MSQLDMGENTAQISVKRHASPTTVHFELLQHARSRNGWQKLTPLQQQRAKELLLAADSPALGIIATDNVAQQKRLGWSAGQGQAMVRALKRARLLSVERQWETLPNGRKRERGPAVWVYPKDDALRPSQIPKSRVKKTEPRIRSLEVQVEILFDEVRRLAREIEELTQAREPHAEAA